MDSQEIGVWLEECLEAAALSGGQPYHASEEARQNHRSTRSALCAELSLLVQEAVEMKWPFVPEKWQYKEAVSSQDKTNLTDLISRNLPQLMALLKAAILAWETCEALAVVFLVDRFLYWSDESPRLLSLTKRLHRRQPGAPVAPQLVLRQARVYLNSGKLHKAEFILSMLIINNGATGNWTYHSESDKLLVQAVSVQVRGLVLQKLGLWLEAAELIWASLIGYFALPQPDKKGIGTSLGLLANILVSMNDEDFEALKNNPDVDLSLLGAGVHRLLAAAEAARLAVVYSQYASLYVLTNVVAQGLCLQSYSFSLACPAAGRRHYLLQAKQAFEIGLLTKTELQPVSSQQELHTFIKAAYSLAVVHRWLQLASETELGRATRDCQEALALFYDYCRPGDKEGDGLAAQERDGLAAEVMRRVGQVKRTLRVEPWPNSDPGSFIPDFYRKGAEERPVRFTPPGFFRLMERFQGYHKAICESPGIRGVEGTPGGGGGAGLSVTAMGTTAESGEREEAGADTPGGCPEAPGGRPEPPRNGALAPTEGNEGLTESESDGGDGLGSSWQNVSSVGSRPGSGGLGGSAGSGGRGGSAGSGAGDHEWVEAAIDTEMSEDEGPVGPLAIGGDDQVKANVGGCRPGPGLPRMHHTSASSVSGGEAFELLEAAIDTETGEDEGPVGPLAIGGATRPMSRLSLGSPLGSLGRSYGSQSSWERISPVPPPSGSGSRGPSCGPPVQPGAERPSAEQLTPTEEPPPNEGTPASSSSFEELEAGEPESPADVPGPEATRRASERNAACWSCREPGALASPQPGKQYVLTEQDYHALLAGVCHDCLLRRLQSGGTKFKLKDHFKAYSGLQLKFSRATGLWTSRETCVYIGKPSGKEGKQRAALWVQFLHQEERLSSYMGKDYLEPKEMQFHLKDVERQMTSQYYITQFNKKLYEQKITAQIFFLPSDALLILEEREIIGCLTVEPYMLGEFVKLTNNTWKKDSRYKATEYGIAFGHFTYLFSERQEVVVDLQGMVSANGKGLTYLTDPQIHSTRSPRGLSNFGERGLRHFLDEQHGPECNSVCRDLQLPPMGGPPPACF
ncbi:alpha-protein kinase 1 [Gadus chalcogrammus]|uniref:alpha-protein kinase 1 n=1 Tax=Gadus chalcogrammus TaxID=1042646 RepID=UPI0024C478AA|nr:alpha-protein kinase 1 [Gadus chalcogrammus]XP_056432103.1 alpha-protein kinase 1 [Gadus chalcogrammus]